MMSKPIILKPKIFKPKISTGDFNCMRGAAIIITQVEDAWEDPQEDQLI